MAGTTIELLERLIANPGKVQRYSTKKAFMGKPKSTKPFPLTEEVRIQFIACFNNVCAAAGTLLYADPARITNIPVDSLAEAEPLLEVFGRYCDGANNKKLALAILTAAKNFLTQHPGSLMHEFWLLHEIRYVLNFDKDGNKINRDALIQQEREVLQKIQFIYTLLAQGEGSIAHALHLVRQYAAPIEISLNQAKHALIVLESYRLSSPVMKAFELTRKNQQFLSQLAAVTCWSTERFAEFVVDNRLPNLSAPANEQYQQVVLAELQDAFIKVFVQPKCLDSVWIEYFKLWRVDADPIDQAQTLRLLTLPSASTISASASSFLTPAFSRRAAISDLSPVAESREEDTPGSGRKRDRSQYEPSDTPEYRVVKSPHQEEDNDENDGDDTRSVVSDVTTRSRASRGSNASFRSTSSRGRGGSGIALEARSFERTIKMSFDTHFKLALLNGYDQVILCDSPPTSVEKTAIKLQRQDGNLIAYWCIDGYHLCKESFPETEVSNIVELLPSSDLISDAPELIKKITLKYGCIKTGDLEDVLKHMNYAFKFEQYFDGHAVLRAKLQKLFPILSDCLAYLLSMASGVTLGGTMFGSYDNAAEASIRAQTLLNCLRPSSSKTCSLEDRRLLQPFAPFAFAYYCEYLYQEKTRIGKPLESYEFTFVLQNFHHLYLCSSLLKTSSNVSYANDVISMVAKMLPAPWMRELEALETDSRTTYDTIRRHGSYFPHDGQGNRMFVSEEYQRVKDKIKELYKKYPKPQAAPR